MRAAIAGAAGFVGFALTKLLVHRWGPEWVQAIIGPVQHATEQSRLDQLRKLGVRITESDLRTTPVLHSEILEFDVLYHLAAYVRSEENSPDVRINDLGTARLIEELGPRLAGKRLVYTSTIAAVDPPPTPSHMTMATPCRPRTIYGATKLAAESILKSAAGKIGFDYAILRFPTIYGPGYRPGGMFDVLARSLPKNALSSRLNWPGKMAIIELHDAARILLAAGTRSDMRNRTFFVSTGEDPTMGEIAGQIASVIGAPYRPITLPGWLVASLGILRSPYWSANWLPHFVKISAWRISLVADGFYCDGSELTDMLGMRYLPWRDGFRGMYRAPD